MLLLPGTAAAVGEEGDHLGTVVVGEEGDHPGTVVVEVEEDHPGTAVVEVGVLPGTVVAGGLVLEIGLEPGVEAQPGLGYLGPVVLLLLNEDPLSGNDVVCCIVTVHHVKHLKVFIVSELFLLSIPLL